MTIWVGVIGVGVMGADHARRMHRVISGATVSAVTDFDTDRAHALEAAITAPRSGLISRTAIAPIQQVEGGDLLAAVTVAEETGPE
jgi:myo-inositol 2-dehydrogenase / D-chiro-inositol 1-dehydrogenase